MSKTDINFLVITVFKVENKLRTKVYVIPTSRSGKTKSDQIKPTNGHSKSKHPNSTKKCIDYSQALRFN